MGMNKTFTGKNTKRAYYLDIYTTCQNRLSRFYVNQTRTYDDSCDVQGGQAVVDKTSSMMVL